MDKVTLDMIANDIESSYRMEKKVKIAKRSIIFKDITEDVKESFSVLIYLIKEAQNESKG